MKFLFSVSEGIKGLSKTRMATSLSMSSIALSIILLGLFTIFILNLNNWISLIRDKIEIELFIDLTASDKEIEGLKKQVEKIEGVKSVQYINKIQAAERFKQETGEDIYEVLNFNPFPASFILTLNNEYRTYQHVERIKKKLETLQHVDEVVYKKQLLETIDHYINIILLIIISFSMIIIFIASVLIYNTIRLTIYARRDTIQIMRLVGATEAFVKRPFIIEGILQGLVGAIIAIIILFYITKGIKYFIYPFLIYDYRIFLVLLLFGLVIGMISAYLSVGRFLRNI